MPLQDWLCAEGKEEIQITKRAFKSWILRTATPQEGNALSAE
jgi:hypothetical protein